MQRHFVQTVTFGILILSFILSTCGPSEALTSGITSQTPGLASESFSGPRVSHPSSIWESVFVWAFGLSLLVASLFLILWALAVSTSSVLPPSMGDVLAAGPGQKAARTTIAGTGNHPPLSASDIPVLAHVLTRRK